MPTKSQKNAKKKESQMTLIIFFFNSLILRLVVLSLILSFILICVMEYFFIFISNICDNSSLSISFSFSSSYSLFVRSNIVFLHKFSTHRTMSIVPFRFSHFIFYSFGLFYGSHVTHHHL